MPDESSAREKKKYEPPTVSVISLRPEEAVLSHCKTSGVGGATAGFDCRHGGGCMTPGS
jgi:hypothetical protein